MCMVLERGPQGGEASDFGTFSEMMKRGAVGVFWWRVDPRLCS